ncbi:hypothetical protein BX600DRAFT_528847 [Xylariales sp. PMI_506]|nr:hypothetical protein BX600DRAFT_528847 [Xylariales sp. PMI_506]
MRLLNTTTLLLESFQMNQVPPYAILSHTWEEDEILFEDLDPANVFELGHPTTNKAGGGHQYIWIDTCCIDKSSSSELSEAINSMFKWYMLSTVCYAYLADVGAFPSRTDDNIVNQFRQCRWPKRGWTLQQELVAPGKLTFFNKSWVSIGTRASLMSVIGAVSKIPLHILAPDSPYKLENPELLRHLSFARKRQTTRTEDQAYSMMGILGINMPLIYGEGRNAFQRLQEEIIRTTDDQSILVFRNLPTDPMLCGERMFA